MFLASSEALIRFKIDSVSAFEHSVEIYYRTSASDIVLGDSIPANAVLPGTSELVNLAVPGEKTPQTRIKVEGYFRDRAPRRAIIGVHFQTLRRGLFEEDHRAIYLMGSRAPLRILEEKHRSWLGRYWATFLSLKSFSSHWIVLPFGGYLRRGEDNFRYRKSSPQERRKLAKSEVGAVRFVDNETTRRNLVMLESTVRLLSGKGAEVCLVTFPFAPDFVEAMREVGTEVVVFDFFEKIAGKHGGKFVNYWDKVAGVDQASTWMANQNHLNEDGARHFGPKAYRDCFGVPSTSLEWNFLKSNQTHSPWGG